MSTQLEIEPSIREKTPAGHASLVGRVGKIANLLGGANRKEPKRVLDYFDALSPEQQEKARYLKQAMSEKFGRPEDDFTVIEVLFQVECS